MANLNPNPMRIEDELQNLELYKYHPSGILNVSLNRLTDMLDGKVELSDPSTPFAYLLETSCLNTAFAIQEFALETRKAHPRLANRDEDLYLHMSDYDFLGRFAQPSYANVIFNILFNDFKSKAVFDPSTRDWVLKIPRHTKVTISGYSYLLTSAVLIRMTENEIVDVKFENQDFNNIFPVETNYINFKMVRINHEETYLNFSLKLPEVDIETTDAPISNLSELKGTLSYNKNRQFYYFRAFHWKDGKWEEMLVTHTNEVYDVDTPTCITQVNVTTSQVHYHIPAVYLNTGKVSGRIRLLIYTTMGKISVNFGDYQISDFRSEYAEVFPETELDIFTRPIQNISMVNYTTDIVESGSNGKTFEEMKAAVIENSIGDRKLPITPKQLEYDVNDSRFKIVKYTDTLTARTYKLETQIPDPLTRYPITKFNLDIVEMAATMSRLRRGEGVKAYGDDITVVPQGTLFEMNNGRVQILEPVQVRQLQGLTDIALTTEVNKHSYLSLYYHYVIDTSNDTTEVRAYDLTTPQVSAINFREFNPTARVGVNTIQANIFKNEHGFGLDILTNLTKYNVAVDVQNVTPYLVVSDVSGSRFYMPGVYHTTLNEQPVYRFLIESGYYIDHHNQIHLQNFYDANALAASVAVDLHSKLEILYVSNVLLPEYAPSPMDQYVNNSFLAGRYSAVTIEDIYINFGDYLERLFTANHTAVGYEAYETYEEDVPLRYTQTVYDRNNHIVYSVGDIVRDETGPVYQYRKGDVKRDAYQNPIPIHQLEVTRFIHFTFIDYRATLATSETAVAYNQQIRRYLTELITENAQEVQSKLLDNSHAYVVVPKTISQVKVKTGSGERVISSMQHFKVDVYVSFSVYNNSTIRENIQYTVVKEIDTYLYTHTQIKKTELLEILYNALREFVISISLTQFTELNTEYMELVDSNTRISVGKLLVVEADGYHLTEDIALDFKIVE